MTTHDALLPGARVRLHPRASGVLALDTSALRIELFPGHAPVDGVVKRAVILPKYHDEKARCIVDFDAHGWGEVDPADLEVLAEAPAPAASKWSQERQPTLAVPPAPPSSPASDALELARLAIDEVAELRAELAEVVTRFVVVAARLDAARAEGVPPPAESPPDAFPTTDD